MEESINLEKRKSIVESTIANFALEGVYPTPFAKELLIKYANGEIKTATELRQLIIEGESK